MIPARNKRTVTGNSIRDQPLEQIHATMNAISPSIKNAEDAKAFLIGKGWLLPGENTSLDTLARTLFSTVVEHKLATQPANPILAVAYLITEQLEEGIKQHTANIITKHLLDSLVPITAEIQTKLEQHLQAVTENIKAHTVLTEKLQQTQEKLEETARQTTANTRTYSQVTAAEQSTPPPNPIPFTPNVSYSQMQIRNREEIKRRQVLIDFERTASMNLDAMDEYTLSRKAADSVNTIWAATTKPKPPRPKLKAATLMRNGGLLLELDSPKAVDWLKREDVRESFLSNMGSGANIKDRTYQVIVQFVPVNFKPDDDQHVREYEASNGLESESVLKAEWIKPVSERRQNQRVATMRVYHRDAISANKILSEGAYVLGKRTSPKKPKKEPIRCLKCQRFGHERRDCRSETPRCGKCAGMHETDSCTAQRDNFKCANCPGSHPSYDRDCPAFEEKCIQTDARRPENNLAFYPTDDSWTWATIEHNAQASPPAANPTSRPNRPNTLRQTQLTGANATPIGRPPTSSQQSQSRDSQ